MPKKCRCTCCDCTEEATTTDDGGVAVCDECSTYFVDDDGTVHCSRETKGFTECPDCREEIRWGGYIQTGSLGSGTPNFSEGYCSCSKWRDEDRGGWGHYSRVKKEDCVERGDD